ncbi:MAG: hypothetical protein PHQ60_16395 [Sideroxydans sp.]|nr:hypothetical protein [Sideroxydans sp.]
MMIVYVDSPASQQRIITSAVRVDVGGISVVIQATAEGLDIIQREGDWRVVPGDEGVVRLVPLLEGAA